MEQDLDLRRYFSIVKRRYLFVILPALVILAATVAVAFLLPKTYLSTATILIESQRIPSELASSTVTSNTNERIKVIEQRLLARDSLLEIAAKYDLYTTNGERPSPTEIVEKMRGAILIEQISVTLNSRRNTEIVGFHVSFEYGEPRMTARVTNELVSSILAQNVETRLNRAAETSDFFKQQLTQLESRLLATEGRLADFKRENEADLPETLDTRRVELTQALTDLSTVDRELRLAASPDATTAVADGSASQQLAFRLQAEQLNYDSLVERRKVLEPLLAKGFVPKSQILDLDKAISLSEINLQSIKAQMSQQGFSADPATRQQLLEETREKLAAKVDGLKTSIARTPTVEVEYAALQREYANLQAEYNQTKAKLAEAETGERLEQDRQAERFEVLEQATVPETPAKPERVKIILAGGFGGLAVGLGLALLLELLDNSIRTSSDLERRLKLRPFAVIPYIETAAEMRQRLRRRIMMAGGVAVAITLAVFAVHFLYLPLDLLAERGWQIIHVRLANQV